jgi:membrane protease YdiL (CAAX protease family)
MNDAPHDTPSSAGVGEFKKLRLAPAVALHLLPGAVAFAVALLIAPLLGHWNLPKSFAITIAFPLALIPIELGLLLRAGHQSTGQWTLRSIGSVISYRERIGRRWWLIPLLFVVALAIAIAWSPVASALGDGLRGVLPGWLLPDYDPADHATRTALIVTSLVALLLDGFVNPTVEELYFRGFLLPRIPLAIGPAVTTSALLFSVQHFWQPYNWGLIFILQLILTTLVVRTKSVRMGIACHVLANVFGATLTLVAALG